MRRPILLTTLALALSACATATPSGAPPSSAGEAPGKPAAPPPTSLTGYFAANPLDGKAILGPPPAVDSPHGRADRAAFDETRALEGSDRWKAAVEDSDLWGGGALRRFSCALGVDLNARETPAAVRLLHRVELDVRTVGTPAKDAYARVRPLIGNDQPICVPREDWMRTNASYPSGHAMTAWAWALILTEAAPARADALLELGRESGESRVICGVHFPSDVEAGRTLAAGMVARLHADRAFMADLAKLKREVAAARSAPKACKGG